MKKIICVLFLGLFVAGVYGGDKAPDIYNLINRGQLREAEQKLQNLPTAAGRDGNHLFLTALLERDARQAAELLKAALASNLDDRYRNDAERRLVCIEEAVGMTANSKRQAYDLLMRTVGEPRAALLATLAANTDPSTQEHKRYLYTLIEEHDNAYFAQYGRLARAYQEYRAGHYESAVTLCRQINGAKNDDLSAAALVLISRIALERGEETRALLNYNIIREKYPYAIGEDFLLGALKRISSEQSGEESREVIEGISYSIQIGVYSVKDNAESMKDRIEKYGLKGRLVRRSISGNTYHVVLAGMFKTMEEAENMRRRLESGEGEVFKVVVNDD